MHELGTYNMLIYILSDQILGQGLADNPPNHSVVRGQVEHVMTAEMGGTVQTYRIQALGAVRKSLDAIMCNIAIYI